MCFVISIFAVTSLFAQKPLSTAEYDFTYKMISSDGTNASAVAWDSKKQLYFTVIAGNVEFPIEGFSQGGSSEYSAYAQVDARGMWYNPKKKCLEINGYGDFGWVSVKINKDMASHSVKQIFSGQLQPDYNSCGTFCPEKKAIAFFNVGNITIDFYDVKSGELEESVSLNISSDYVDEFNSTTICYTGKKGYEFVLLNYNGNKLVFFDLTGTQTGESKLPWEATPNDMFRFSFANNRAFIYNVDDRFWTAYKVF